MGAYSSSLRTLGAPPETPVATLSSRAYKNKELAGSEEPSVADDAAHAPPEDDSETFFLFAYFRTRSENLHYAVSSDGLKWLPLHNGHSVLKASRLPSTVGSIRDPFVLRLENGAEFILVHSDGWQSSGFILWRSTDLINWKDEIYVPIMNERPEIGCVWAPKVVFDKEKEEYVCLWSSAKRKKMDYKTIWACRTKDFLTYGAPYELFDPGYSVIDAHIIHQNDKYYMFFKDERGWSVPGSAYKAIRCTSATTIDGLSKKEHITSYLTHTLTEGPCAVPTKDFTFLYYDPFMTPGAYRVSYCKNLEAMMEAETLEKAVKGAARHHWTEIHPNHLKFPTGARHGSVIMINRQEYEALLRRWPKIGSTAPEVNMEEAGSASVQATLSPQVREEEGIQIVETGKPISQIRAEAGHMLADTPSPTATPVPAITQEAVSQQERTTEKVIHQEVVQEGKSEKAQAQEGPEEAQEIAQEIAKL